MKDFTVSIFPAREKKFLASYAHPISKKRVRAYFETKDKAVDHKRKTEARFKRTEYDNYQNLKVEELLCLFNIAYPEADFFAGTMYIADFVEFFGHLHLEDLTTEALKLWLDQIQMENGLAEISMRCIKSNAEAFFRFLIEKDLISESPMKTIYYKKFVPDINSRNLLSEDEIEKILASVKDFSPGYLYPIIKICAETGAKPGEVLSLKWDQVDLEKRQIQFLQTEKIQARTLKISEELEKLLASKKKTTAPVFMTYYGEPFTMEKLFRALTEFRLNGSCKQKWTPTDLRHSFAVNFLAKGGEMKQLQYLIGHYNVFMTRTTYGGAIPNCTKASN